MRIPLALLLLIGCGNEPPRTDTARASRTVAHDLSASEPQLGEGVVLLPPTCAEGAEERCDALDSDCDGRIDESCAGISGAAMSVAVAWNGGADVDLEASGPRELQRSASRADCAHEDRIERASASALAAGRYRVALRYADACGTEGPVTATVSVAVGERVLGIFNRSLSPGERAEIVRFDLR